MKKGSQYINKKNVQAALVCLAKKLSEVPDGDDTTCHAFMWGAAAVAYMSGAYDSETFEDVRDEAYDIYDHYIREKTA